MSPGTLCSTAVTMIFNGVLFCTVQADLQASFAFSFTRPFKVVSARFASVFQPIALDTYLDKLVSFTCVFSFYPWTGKRSKVKFHLFKPKHNLCQLNLAQIYADVQSAIAKMEEE